MQIHKREVLLPDGKLRLIIWQPASPRLTLLCLHGWTLDHRSFFGQQELAARGVRVVAFDRRGFGVNYLSPGLERELEDLRLLLEHLPGPVYAYGVSQGARLLLRYAARFPVTLAGLILQGGLVDGLPSEATEIPYLHYAALLKAGDHRAFSREWLAHPLMRSGVPPGKRAAVASLIDGYAGRDLLESSSSAISEDLTQVLPGLFSAEDLPVWVIEAEQESEARRTHAHFLIKECGAKAIPMPGGHLCHFTHAQEFNSRLLAALGLSGDRANSGD